MGFMSKNRACVLGVLHDTAVQNHDHIRKKKEKVSIVKGSTQDAKNSDSTFSLVMERRWETRFPQFQMHTKISRLLCTVWIPSQHQKLVLKC